MNLTGRCGQFCAEVCARAGMTEAARMARRPATKIPARSFVLRIGSSHCSSWTLCRPKNRMIASQLTGLAGRKARRFEPESFAAGGAQRNQEAERKHLPCRRVGHIQDRQAEIVAQRLRHIEATAAPKEARFEKRRDKA